MEVRLMGLPDEVREASRVMREAFRVVEERGPYGNRGDSELVRTYLKVVPHGVVPVRAHAVRADRPEVGIDAPRQIGYSPRRRRRT